MAEEAFQTASDVAYQIISQKILDGEFPPGMKLSRRKMAEAAGVSVIPVIEALKRLESDSLVESKPQWPCLPWRRSGRTTSFGRPLSASLPGFWQGP